MKIFGREPSIIIGFLGAVITALAALNMDFLDAGQAAALTGAISALIIAVTTRPIGPALFAAAFVAVSALFAEYGMRWSDAQVAGWSGAILAGFALFGIRPQVTPVIDQAPIAPANGQVR